MRSARVVAVLACMCASVSSAQQISVKAGVTAAPDSVRVGDPFRVTVGIRAPRGATIEFPRTMDSASAVQSLDPVDFFAADRRGSRGIGASLSVTLAGFVVVKASGSAAFPVLAAIAEGDLAEIRTMMLETPVLPGSRDLLLRSRRAGIVGRVHVDQLERTHPVHLNLGLSRGPRVMLHVGTEKAK